MTTPTDPVVLVVGTHPDDEFVGMGAAIRNHTEHGFETHVMWTCDGSGSAVQPSTGLSDAAFIAARDDESERATRSLGVRYNHMHIPAHRAAGGELTAEMAFAQIRGVIQYELPPERPVWLKGYSDRPVAGRHPDHVATGQGLRMALDEGYADNLRLYAEPWLRQAYLDAGVRLSPETCTNVGWLARAAFELRCQDPAAGKYGIAARSVGPFVTAMETGATCWWHLP